MTRTSPLETMMLLLGMALLASLGALALLGSARQVFLPAVQRQAEIPWTEVDIPQDLVINEHAAKHAGQQLDAWKIYAMYLEGQCVATAVFCGPSDIEKLYLCMDPTGRIGGLYQFGEEITGHQGSLGYWARKVKGSQWGACND